MSKHPMTVLGAEALKTELQRLKFVERPRIVLMKGVFKTLRRNYRTRKLLILVNYLITEKWFLALQLRFVMLQQMLN